MACKTSFTLTAALVLAAVSAAAKPPSNIPQTDFLGKPVGARFIGMGEVGAALTGSPESPVYNPASLGEVAGASLSADFQVANQSNLPEEVLLKSTSLGGKKLTYLGFAGQGRAIFYRPLADYDYTVVNSTADPANNFEESSLRVNQFGISASQEAEKGYSVGLGLSYLSAQRGYAKVTGQTPVVEMASGNGITVDLGFRDKTGDVSYGLSLLNVAGLIYWDKYKTDQLPMIVRAGLGFQPVPVFGFYSDYEKRFFKGDTPDTDYWHFGMELAPVTWLILRTGAVSEDLNNRQKTAFSWGLTFGTASKYRIDASLKTTHYVGERVQQFDMSLVLPLPSKD